MLLDMSRITSKMKPSIDLEPAIINMMIILSCMCQSLTNQVILLKSSPSVSRDCAGLYGEEQIQNQPWQNQLAGLIGGPVLGIFHC